ncbi:MAG: hypothetical protein WCD38_13510 [Candidatus Tumulicola sp.]
MRRSTPARERLGVTRAWFGRTQGEAPGVDGGVYFGDPSGAVRAGDFVDVALEGHDAFDFFGRAASREPVSVG